MSDIRFNQWLHQSGTGGVSQSDGGHVGIGTTNPDTMPYKQVNFSDSLKDTIYYAIEKGGYITTSETDVVNGNEIKYSFVFLNVFSIFLYG